MAITEAVEHSVWQSTEPAEGRVSEVALEQELHHKEKNSPL